MLKIAAPIVIALTTACVASPSRAECPGDRDAGPDTLLSVRIGDKAPVRLDRAALAALPTQQSIQSRTVAPGAGAGAGVVEQQIVYTGVPLPAIVAGAIGDDPHGRDQRAWVIDAVATDGYRALFSWGELFNTDAGQLVLVIVTQDGRPLDAREGPLALRALADRRPGPRHVRNLCAVTVLPLPPAGR